MSGHIQDRRENRRRHLLYYLDVCDEVTGVLLGQLGDITEEGLLVISQEPLDLEQERTMRVSLPTARGFSETDLVFRARSCWSGPDINPDLVCTGYQFIAPDSGLQKSIERLIQLFGFKD